MTDELRTSPSLFPALPQRWDGDVVKWDDWQEGVPTSADFHFGPRTCDGCHSTIRPYWTFGRRQPGRGEVFETWKFQTITARWGTTYQVHRPIHVPAWPVIQFHATRCAWCGHTEVYDFDSTETWTLDDTDYGPDGSTRPTGTPHPAALDAAQETR